LGALSAPNTKAIGPVSAPRLSPHKPIEKKTTMNTTTNSNTNINREPPITLIKDDFNKLSKLAALRGNSAVAEYLAYELDRAQVVEDTNTIDNVVRLGSRIRFRDHAKTTPSDVVLVMPHEADIAKGYISVMTPVGAALLGLTKGQAITFTLPNGDDRTLTVLQVGSPGNSG
jgi:regulator of nucleoside diphosphate kinase